MDNHIGDLNQIRDLRLGAQDKADSYAEGVLSTEVEEFVPKYMVTTSSQSATPMIFKPAAFFQPNFINH